MKLHPVCLSLISAIVLGGSMAGLFGAPPTHAQIEARAIVDQVNVEETPISGSPRARLIGHKRSVNDLRFSPDGKVLATSGEDNTARLWNVASGELLSRLNGSSSVGDLLFSPDGRLLAIWSLGKTVELWDVKEQRLKEVLQGKKNLTDSVAFSPDSRTVATASP